MVTMSAGKTLYERPVDAVADMQSGSLLAVGGFGPMQNRPITILAALAQRPEVTDLTIVANNFPHAPLAEQRQVKKLIAAFGASVYRRQNSHEDQIRSGELEFEPSPQGIFTERLRAGAAGIPAFYSPVGVHTVVAEGKERRVIDGREYILETALRPDFGFVRARTADENGNLTGVGSTLNFHPAIAAASRVTVAEVDEVVPAGSIPPEHVTIPGIYVDRIVMHDTALDEEIGQQDRQRQARRAESSVEDRIGLTHDLMALRVAQMLQAGQYVNLGMGLPVQVSNFVTPESGVNLHSENGLLGYGPQPTEDEYLWYFYNAIGQPVTALPGASVFDSVQAFTMARGGHLDVVILGGLQVSGTGDLANWWAPYMAAGGMGGAMDLCTNVPELIILMEHCTRDGDPKIVNECTYPLTAKAAVTRIVTELAHIEVTVDGLVVRELAPGITFDHVRERTEPELRLAEDCGVMLQ